MNNLTEKWREFREWQKRPYQVAKLSEEHHCCTTCGQEYQGNYCPRCGQSAKIGRYSFKSAVLLFLDVWGVGNRGMFRTLRDLILRPGYMIRDYISGMQMAYFPPFKMLFLLSTLSILVSSGFNLEGKNSYEDTDEKTEKTEIAAKTVKAEKSGKTKKIKKAKVTFDDAVDLLDEYDRKYANVTTLTMLFLMSGFMYIFFRKCPNIPDMRFSELLVALVYISNMCSFYTTVVSFFCAHDAFYLTAVILPIIALKQLSGFKWLKFIFIMIFTYLIALFLLISAIVSLLISLNEF